jgi:DnaJ-class molecular chaperone
MTRIAPRPARVASPTAYDELGVSPVDPADVIHDAYLALARELHPDKGGDGERFKAVALAWGILKREEGRRIYDAKLRLERRLDCEECKGTGRRSGFVGGKYNRNVKCAACAGRGHL